MKVVNVGHDNCILTEYNGKKYAFYKDIPIEISEEIFRDIVRSGYINAQDIRIYEEPKAEEKPKETIIEKVTKVIIKSKGKKKK